MLYYYKIVCDMYGMLDLLCIPYSGACDVFVTCHDTNKQNRRSKNSMHENITHVTKMSPLHLKYFHLIITCHTCHKPFYKIRIYTSL